ncbi:Aste57867_12075 [Aphanomyces stellatus]|uniref:Carboxypeptidase n=1 Tax=Aphanomyces stellatus TaxID=120398 RepID=A0A485KVU1_9STRA|nr:hypothetical protein As57867_012030 [Aphanomyces stellatus]VFT88930.1 Aste57867_12075 [Aphanomyces stellatus]
MWSNFNDNFKVGNSDDRLRLAFHSSICAESSVLAMLSAVLVGLVASVAMASNNPHKITSLPNYVDAKPINFDQYSGHIALPSNGQNMFYWHVESESNPATAPLVLWLNGGPGCSSLTGFFTELGPFVVNSDLSVTRNPYAWNRKVNMIFLESPGGVGFSTAVNNTQYQDDFTTARAYEFLQEFFTLYPAYKHREFYVTGESYGGMYVPFLVHKLVTEPIRDVKLTGFAIGNAYTDTESDAGSYLDYFYSHALISLEMYEHAQAVCPGNAVASCMGGGGNCSDACASAFMDVLETTHWMDAATFDEYNIYGDVCKLPKTQVTALQYHAIRSNTHRGETGPCAIQFTTTYLNQDSVQRAIHNDVGHIEWGMCNMNIAMTYNRTASALSKYPTILQAGLKALIYSGDADSSVNFIGTQRWLKNKLKLKVQANWTGWMAPDKQLAGFVEEYTNVTFKTVKGAGHMVPTTRPLHALYMFECFVFGQAACATFSYPKDALEYLSGADLTVPFDKATDATLWWVLGALGVVAIVGAIGVLVFKKKQTKKTQYVELTGGDSKAAYST